MSDDKSNLEDKKPHPVLNINTGTLCAVDLPTFGRVHVAPYINVGTIMAIEEKFSSREPTATELVNAVFAGRAEVEESNGRFREVTREEIDKLTDEDRMVFSRAFLSMVRGAEDAPPGDTESPVEALAAYVVAEWQQLQESSKEVSGMIKAGFSEKTINLFKESQSLAERVMAANKLPHFAEMAKYQPAFGALGAASSALGNLNSPAIKAALRVRETPTWKSVIELTESPMAKAARQFEHTHGVMGRELGSGKTALEKALKQLNSSTDDQTIQINALPRIKSAEQIMAEHLGNLKKDIGERLDRVGNAAVDIALQQDKTNSTIMSALVDMRIKWKEDEVSNRNSLRFAALSLFISALLTAVGVGQDYLNNKEGDKYQEQVTKLMTQQAQTMEQQRRLLEQLAKTNEATTPQLEVNSENLRTRRTAGKRRGD